VQTKSTVTVGLVGFGVVGGGVVELLKRHRADIAARVGARVKLKWVCSRRRKIDPLLSKSILQTPNWRDIVDDPEVDCVVELMGGTEPARTLVISALQKGKHVVTANKAILSKYWDFLFETARKNRALLYFEAAVGGGVPVVQALNEGLAGNEIKKVVGILNGTSNYILTRMHEEGVDYAEALKEAQAAGFAESNPAFDVKGIDAAQKISILASLAAGQWVAPERVHCEGISGLHPIDIRMVQERLKSVIKLLGIAERTPQGWLLRVHPTLVPRRHPFATVRNEYNAVALHGDAVGDIMLYGKGAGRYPTSSAVLSDLIFVCRHIANGTAGQLPYVSAMEHRHLSYARMNSLMTRAYLRVTTKDRPGVLAKITGILGRKHVSIASVHQDLVEGTGSSASVPIVLLTHTARESDIQAAVKLINALPSVKAPTVMLRME
jgi:homoserine dehydrogenase